MSVTESLATNSVIVITERVLARLVQNNFMEHAFAMRFL
jgi:hypothetical protein